MTLIVNCAGCAKKLKVRAEFSRLKLKCPHCGVLVNRLQERPRRLGVSLSGGGLRASFFHIGVLAQMARLGMLRHIEVLSTVSGGSIIGTLYYLHVKRLLEAKEDADVTDQDYREIVQQIEKDFFQAVQKNFRVRSLLNPLNLLKSCLPDSSRTDEVGYLFDRYLFRPVLDPRRKTPLAMREMRIHPLGGPAEFRPHKHNAGRSAKVPVLLLNATTLNTGHNWRFEAARMGETQMQSSLALEIDKLARLRRPPSYEDLTPQHRDIELGLAVAASCCVPGLLPPLALSKLYDRGIRVQLVDGGVRDNQGIDGLLDLCCTDFVISDGSQQMREEIDPSERVLPILVRSIDIVGNQVRSEMLFRLLERHPRRVALLHLRKGLSAEAVAWLGRDGRAAAPVQVESPHAEHYGIPEEIQEDLSRIRTDLDAFTEVEAFSLMLDAYLLSAAELSSLGDLAGSPAAEEDCPWRFRAVEPWLRQPTPAYRRLLDLAQYRHCKLFRLKWATSLILALAMLGGGVWLANEMHCLSFCWDCLVQSVQVWIVSAALVSLGFIGLIQFTNVLPIPSQLRTPIQVVVGLLMALTLFCLSLTLFRVQLYILQPLYQRAGRLDRLKPPPTPPKPKPVQKQQTAASRVASSEAQPIS